MIESAPGRLRRWAVSPALCLVASVASVASVVAADGESAAPAARDAPEEALEKVDGVFLSVRRDAESVTVFHGETRLARYRYGGSDIRKPYLAELMAPGGANVLLDAPPDHPHHHGLMFACTVDGVDFWAEGKGDGREVHLSFEPLQVRFVSRTEAAVITEHLQWIDGVGRPLINEKRIVTVLQPGGPLGRSALWESYLTPAAGRSRVTLGGRAYHGLGLRFARNMARGGAFFSSTGATGVAGTNGKKAAWCAYRPFAPSDTSVTTVVAALSTNHRHPSGWFTMAEPFSYLTATQSLPDTPLVLTAGGRFVARFGVRLFAGKVEIARIHDAYRVLNEALGDEPPHVLPGLLARYTPVGESVTARPFSRIDAKLSFDWRDGVPDERLPRGPFHVEWTGSLFISKEDSYRFALDAVGAGRVMIDGRTVASAISTKTSPAPKPVELDHGFHKIRVEYTCTAPAKGAAVCLRWGVGAAPLTVLPARVLFHDARREVPAARDRQYERGSVLAARLRCASCHGATRTASEDEPGPNAPLPARSLARAGWMDPGYLTRYVARPLDVEPGAAMPGLRGRPEKRRGDASALAAFLRSASEPPPPPLSYPPGSAGQGRERFLALGCGACHATEGPVSPPGTEPGATPALTSVAAKWPLHVLVDVLRRPAEFRPWGVMPDFRLKQLQAVDIAAYLASLRGSGAPESSVPRDSLDERELVERGRRLFRDRGCGACHEEPALADGEARHPPAPVLVGRPPESFARGCLSGEEPREEIPRFELTLSDRQALAVYFHDRPLRPADIARQELGLRAVREELGCIRCHELDGRGGDELRLSFERPGGSGLERAARLPPPLTGAAARLQLDWITGTLEGSVPSARPWLTVRMPSYADAADVETLVHSLVAADRGPAGVGKPVEPQKNASQPAELGAAARKELRENGRRLLGPTGFNCQQCHFVGLHRPTLDTVGPDLAVAGERSERSWFFRWLQNPGALRPGTPMPALTTAIPGVLDGDIATQKQVLWDYFTRLPPEEITVAPPAARPLDPAPGRALIVQARVRGRGPLRAERGVALGFPSGPGPGRGTALLFDAGRLSWLGSWRGGFLERVGQHGAHAWWRPRGEALGEAFARSPPVLFRKHSGGGWWGPALRRGRFGRFDFVEYLAGARRVRLGYRLELEGGGWLRLVETVRTAEERENTVDVERSLEIAGVEGRDASAPVAAEIIIPVGAELVGLGGAPRELDVVSSGTPLHKLRRLTWPRGTVEVRGADTAAWVVAPPRVLYPVIEPFTDDPPQPGATFAPEEEEGRGRAAIAMKTSTALSGGAVRILLRRLLDGGTTAAVARVAQRPAPPMPNLDVSAVSLPDGYTIARLPLAEDFLPCAMVFHRDRLLVAGYDGEVRWALDSNADGLPDRYEPFAGPLEQANSLLVAGHEVIVASPGAVYSLRDRDGDGAVDVYRTLSSAWDYAGHPFDWFFGFAKDLDGNLYGANTTPHERGKTPGRWRRGTVLKIAPDGTTTAYAGGTRYEFGWTTDRAGRSFFTVNQGPWNITCSIRQLEEGAHYGYGEKDASKVAQTVVQVPYPWCHALTGVVLAESEPRFGVFAGQGFAGDYNTRRLIRWTHYPVRDRRQGACYDFVGGLDCGPTGLCFGPDGALYVAVMADGSWYPERPRGGIYRIVAAPGNDAAPAFEVREARATADGVEVSFTAPVEPATVAGACRKVHRYFHAYRGGYYSVETDREDVPVTESQLAADGRTLHLRLARPHATPRIYRLRLRGLRAADGRELRTGPFFLTVHQVPGR